MRLRWLSIQPMMWLGYKLPTISLKHRRMHVFFGAPITHLTHSHTNEGIYAYLKYRSLFAWLPDCMLVISYRILYILQKPNARGLLEWNYHLTPTTQTLKQHTFIESIYYIYNDFVIVDALNDACKLIILPTVCVAKNFQLVKAHFDWSDPSAKV